MMTKEAKTKLIILADFLAKKVKPEWFDMEQWGTRGFPEKKCNTTACAVGWATVAFPNQGLELVNSSSNALSPLDIRYLDLDYFDASAAFFNINLHAAHFLFAPECYPKERAEKKQVVARIRQMVKTGMYGDGTNSLALLEVSKWEQ